MLVATAGHIDHGKTSLVRALTGVETDRLPEERARGISIDLGFAYWPQPGGQDTIGFIDVPGHERFVRNMLAGVGGIDFALLVVAADDGVMPQTVEHVQILDLLGISRGIVAITKCDRSPQERRTAVREHVHALLARTTLAGVSMVEVSIVTGEGVAGLGGALRAANGASTPRETAGRNFRLAIDRAFSVTGAGTVVTGTVLGGVLETGARLILSPRGLETRVRGLQSAGRAVDGVRAGERCAINLAGIELAEVHRGDWLLVPPMHAPVTRLEARLKVLHDRSDVLKHNTPVHLHLGTADIGARVLLPDQKALPAGGEAVVHLVLDQASAAVTGDRFVLRDQPGRHTIGGGRVIDPFPPVRRRHQAAVREQISAALETGDAAGALQALLAIPGHEVDTAHFERCFNLEAEAAQVLYRQSDTVRLSGAPMLALPAAGIAAASEEVLNTLKEYHRTTPDAEGMTARELRVRLSAPMSAKVYAAVLKDLTEKRLIESAGPWVKLAGHMAVLSPADTALWRQVLFYLEERGASPFTPSDLARELRVSDAVIKSLLYRKSKHGAVWRMGGERFLLREHVATLAAQAAAITLGADSKGFTAAQYRDATGIGRNMVIRILEFFDSVGVTHRTGDMRKVRPDYEQLVGSR